MHRLARQPKRDLLKVLGAGLTVLGALGMAAGHWETGLTALAAGLLATAAGVVL